MQRGSLLYLFGDYYAFLSCGGIFCRRCSLSFLISLLSSFCFAARPICSLLAPSWGCSVFCIHITRTGASLLVALAFCLHHLPSPLPPSKTTYHFIPHRHPHICTYASSFCIFHSIVMSFRRDWPYIIIASAHSSSSIRHFHFPSRQTVVLSNFVA